MPKVRTRNARKTRQAARQVVRLNPHRSIVTGHLPGLAPYPLAWESYLEQIATKLLSVCHDVRSIATQPTVLEIHTAERSRKYHPDLLLKLETEGGLESILVEIKPLAVLVLEPTLTRLLQVADECMNQGIRFCILTDDQIYAGPNRQNALLLWRYMKGAMPPADRIERLSMCLERGGPMQIQQLLDAADIDLVDVYTLLAKRLLRFSKSEVINRRALVALPAHTGGLRYADVQAAGRYGDLVEEVALGHRPPDWRILETQALQRRPRPGAGVFSAVGGFSGAAPLRDLRPEEYSPRSAWAGGGLSFDRGL